jgi:hypothetical protein
VVETLEAERHFEARDAVGFAERLAHRGDLALHRPGRLRMARHHLLADGGAGGGCHVGQRRNRAVGAGFDGVDHPLSRAGEQHEAWAQPLAQTG